MIEALIRLYYYGSVKALLRRYYISVRSRGGGGGKVLAILLRLYY